jgi:hypothetical protein
MIMANSKEKAMFDKATQEKLDKARAMDKAEFVVEAIHKLRTGQFKGIHTVYSGFNKMLQLVYPKESPVDIVKDLCDNEGFGIRPVKGGVILYAPEDVDEAKANSNAKTVQKTLDKIL